MVQTQHTAPHGERRQSSRADALLRFNYQEISKEQAELDPYNPEFMIPRYFLLLSELAQIDSVLEWEIDAIKTEHPGFGHIFSLLNQKIDLIKEAVERLCETTSGCLQSTNCSKPIKTQKSN